MSWFPVGWLVIKCLIRIKLDHSFGIHNRKPNSNCSFNEWVHEWIYKNDFSMYQFWTICYWCFWYIIICFSLSHSQSLIDLCNLSLPLSMKINTIIMAHVFANKEMTYNYSLLNTYVQVPDLSKKWYLWLINFDLWSLQEMTMSGQIFASLCFSTLSWNGNKFVFNCSHMSLLFCYKN